MKTYRLGVIGFAHMHVNTLIDTFNKLPNVEWVACADTKPTVPSLSQDKGTRAFNLKRALTESGIPKAYDDYREMLEKEQFDIVIFCPENARHAEVAEAVAAKGIHMITEKPMATSYRDAERMVRAARAHNVRLGVNWPTTWMSWVRKAHELATQGEIGEVWQLRWRNGASRGPFSHGQTMTDEEKAAEWWYRAEDGGGAFWDYNSYGACMARWFLGQRATEVSTLNVNLYSHFGDVPDHSAMLVRFPKGIAVLEGTWATYHIGESPGQVVYGTAGTIVIRHKETLLYTDRKSSEPTAVFPSSPLPEGRRNLAEEFVHHIETGEPLHPTLDPDLNLDAMAILDAGARSAASGRHEKVQA